MNAPIHINDEPRQRYLREMGIVVYYPRHPLPGAAVSRRYHVSGDAGPEPVQAGASVTGREEAREVSGRVPEHDGVPAGLDGLKDRLSAAPSPAPEPPREPVRDRQVPAASQSQPRDNLAFRFTWFRPDERLGVLAGHTEARLPRQFQQMLQRILAALSPRYREVKLPGEPFHWPLDAAMPGDVDAARQVVRAFLRRRCGGTHPPLMLILMDEPPVWLFPTDAGEAAAAMLEPVAVPGVAEQVLRVPALETMASDPAAKRPAWEAMQSLIRPLARRDQD